MLYQIEEVKTRKNIKLVIVYIVILLLVLLASIGLGILAVHYFQEEQNNEALIGTQDKEDDNNSTKNVIESDLKDNLNKENFYDIIEDIYNGKEGKRVFLTFDDGPSQSVTPHILDTLKEYNIKATFFVLGSRVSSNTDLIKREYEEGHYIANHGYTHKYSNIYISSNTVLKEYNKTEEKIKEALGMPEYSSNLFRFPGGSVGGPYDKIKRKAKQVLKEQNIAYLDWNALTYDADGANTKEKIMKNIKETVDGKENVVVLMHDAPDKILTYETLPDVIQYLKEKGYAFKNVYDLIKTEE